jgi:Domain of unknown function (DUF1905)/Bacteriocin-protection, YdeI or OmpD-Associated
LPEKKLRFHVKLEGEKGSTATWMNAPFDVQETFGTKARVPVRGTINGFPFRSSLMPMGGCHGMAVNRAMRDGAKAQAGDVVDVVLQRDSEERAVEAPTELKKELVQNQKAQERWEKLSFTHKKEMALSITGAKQEETKKRRLVKVMQVLKTGAKWTG